MKDSYKYGYGQNCDMVAKLKGPDIATGRKDAMGMDRLAKKRLAAKLSGQLMGKVKMNKDPQIGGM